jgi:hypothetical protein
MLPYYSRLSETKTETNMVGDSDMVPADDDDDDDDAGHEIK